MRPPKLDGARQRGRLVQGQRVPEQRRCRDVSGPRGPVSGSTPFAWPCSAGSVSPTPGRRRLPPWGPTTCGRYARQRLSCGRPTIFAWPVSTTNRRARRNVPQKLPCNDWLGVSLEKQMPPARHRRGLCAWPCSAGLARLPMIGRVSALGHERPGH